MGFYKEKYDAIVVGGALSGMHVIAAKAICLREAMQPEFQLYAEHIVKNAAALARALQARGFDLVSGGTDNHLMRFTRKVRSFLSCARTWSASRSLPASTLSLTSMIFTGFMGGT